MASITVGRYLSSLLDSVKAVTRGGAKGATAEADVTSTSVDADHQALDVADVYSKHKFKPSVRTTKAGNAASLGDNTLHTPASGKRIRLFWVGLATAETNAATNLAIVKFGAAGTAVYRWPLGAPGAFSHWEPVEGGANEALVLNLSSTDPVEWNVTLEEF